MLGEIVWLRLVREVFSGEDLVLRGWAGGTRKMLAFHLGLRDSTAEEYRSTAGLWSPQDTKTPSLTLQTALSVFML